MHEGQYTKKSATFEDFERRYSGAGFDPDELAIQLNWHADNYDVIRGKAEHGSARVEAALAKLRGLDASTTRPLLLNLLLRFEEGDLNEEDLARSIEMVSGFILRRYVCGENSRAYGTWFVAACRALGNEPVDGLRRFLTDNKEYPDDARFERCLVRFNLYQSDYGRYVLERLERSYDHKEPPDLSKTQIEHIMPQTLNDDWRRDLGPEHERVHSEMLHTLGNLTLSGYNPELFNHAFSIKREKYDASNVALTRQLADRQTWGEEDIRARGVELARRAKKIWRGP